MIARIKIAALATKIVEKNGHTGHISEADRTCYWFGYDR